MNKVRYGRMDSVPYESQEPGATLVTVDVNFWDLKRGASHHVHLPSMHSEECRLQGDIAEAIVVAVSKAIAKAINEGATNEPD